jgi:hypothetical protein
MPKATKTEQDLAGLYKFPAGEYFPARMTKVDERSFSWDVKEYKDGKPTGNLKYDSQGEVVRKSKTVWRWFFEITEGDYKGETGYGETENELTSLEDNKCRQYAETLLGQEIALGADFDTDTVVGLPCMVSFLHEDPRRGRDGTMFYGCLVDEVLPYTPSIPY